MSAIERMDPARSLDTADPRLAAALDGLGAATAASPRPAARARRRRLRIGLAGIAVAAVLATAGTATAGWLSIHTGRFGDPGTTENDTSEFLRTTARSCRRCSTRSRSATRVRVRLHRARRRLEHALEPPSTRGERLEEAPRGV